MKSHAILVVVIVPFLSACAVLPGLNRSDEWDSDARISQYRSTLDRDQPAGLQSEEPRGRFFMPTVKPSVLPGLSLTVTPEVEKELNYFRTRDTRFIKKSLKRLGEYLPVLQQIFEDEGVPTELINVALIESGFDPKARSNAGAVGMWQFMRSTGRYYGLRAGIFGDQRKDPILSSIAAARHLRDLYISFQDWNLALAAYNAGAGRVYRAAKRSGTRDFWVLCRKRALPLQTRRYVPKVIAASIITRNLGKFSSVPVDRE